MCLCVPCCCWQGAAQQGTAPRAYTYASGVAGSLPLPLPATLFTATHCAVRPPAVPCALTLALSCGSFVQDVTPQELYHFRTNMAKYWPAFMWWDKQGGQAYNYTLKSLRRKLYNLWGKHYHHHHHLQ